MPPIMIVLVPRLGVVGVVCLSIGDLPPSSSVQALEEFAEEQRGSRARFTISFPPRWTRWTEIGLSTARDEA